MAAALTALSLQACASARPGQTSPDSAPEGISILKDLPYATRAGEPLLADVYRPLFGRRAAVLVVHPGGWFSGDKRDVSGTAMRLAEAGYVAVAPQYRLAPRHRFPAQIHDLKEVVRWMRFRADSLGLDPARIAAFGYSSGGHLAALLATSGPGDGLEGESEFPGTSSRVQALVAGGTPADLLAMPPNPAVSSLLGGSAADDPALAAEASPLSFVSADDPPAFLYHGRLDGLIRASQARGFLRAFERAGVPAQLDLGILGHFSTWLFARDQEARAFAFLDRWLGSGEATRLAAELPAEPRS